MSTKDEYAGFDRSCSLLTHEQIWIQRPWQRCGERVLRRQEVADLLEDETEGKKSTIISTSVFSTPFVDKGRRVSIITPLSASNSQVTSQVTDK